MTHLRAEYNRRAHDHRYDALYSRFNPGDVFILQERERQVLHLLSSFAQEDWYNLRVLDIGCGDGHQLARFIAFGINALHLTGMDLMYDRVKGAKARYPNAQFVSGNAERLAFANNAFDLILQFTVFTSVLDEGMRSRMAREMLRVLSPKGLILWYDYRLNPTNAKTRGIEKREIKNLFPDCDHIFHRVTLAPPLARWVTPRSWITSALLSQVSFLKTHYLALIQKHPHETSL